jgi:MOSC domain-containing protein YiiM
MAPGAQINVISRPEHGITIRDIFEAKAGERGKIAKLKEVTALSNQYKEWLHKL